MRSYIFCLSFLLLPIISVFAENKGDALLRSESESLRFLGEFDDWSLYTQIENGQKACFMISSPLKKLGTYKSRKEQFLWVRHVNNNMDEVSVTPGYQFKDKTHPEIAFYKKQNFVNYKQSVIMDSQHNTCSFKNENTSYMFDITDKEQAWVRDIETDKKIIKDMKDSNYAIVSAHSMRGSCSLDIYSLMGFTKAYKKMKEECNAKSKKKNK